MTTIKYRPVLLCLAVLALLVSALAATAHPAHAAPSANAGQTSTVALSAPTAPSTPCNFTESLPTCESTDPTVAYYDTVTGNPADCTFVFDVAWGDGASTTTTVTNPVAGSHNLVGEHTYADPGTYTITVSPQVTAGTSCTATSSVHTFTLLAPTPTPVPTPTPPATSTIVLVPAGTVQLHGHTVLTYLVEGPPSRLRGHVVVALPITQDCARAIVVQLRHKAVEEVLEQLPVVRSILQSRVLLVPLIVYAAWDVVKGCNPDNVRKIHTKPIQSIKLHMKPVQADKIHVKS